MRNGLSVDVEEWFQVGAFERVIAKADWDGLDSRVAYNTGKVLDLFGETGVKATFFTLGWVAERNPSLVRRIADEGHDVVALAELYWTNTTFGHCLFVAPVIAWLVWQRRAELALVSPQGWWPGLVLVAAGGFGWLLGDAGGVSFARHLGVVMMLQGAVVTILGPNVARGLLFPIAYALFLVPFGEFLESPLQTITVWITMHLLHLVGVAATVDGVLITAGDKYFEVAEA